MIGVLDYGMGNLRSVLNAFAAIGAEARLIATPAALSSVRAVVIPGVGSFAEGAARITPFRNALGDKPILGICLGMQLLAEGSDEGEGAGLGLVKGHVRALSQQHVGWNDVVLTRKSTLLEESDCFYFVHGYALVPAERAVVTAETEHGVAAIEHGRVFATQFHPEKSQAAGLAVLRRFVSAC